MKKEEILQKVQEILADVIDNENLVLTEESSPANEDDWDSLAHFQLVMELQNEFSIKFPASEIQSWQNVGDIIASIQQKIG